VGLVRSERSRFGVEYIIDFSAIKPQKANLQTGRRILIKLRWKEAKI
jgi:hypothetical protein